MTLFISCLSCASARERSENFFIPARTSFASGVSGVRIIPPCFFAFAAFLVFSNCLSAAFFCDLSATSAT
uniref:Uncharacterized protein n=1 Tax=uncultured marine virus TaxID=186617 RepID=A0A0F7L547_9VIRU|nr:hypothetical protein [uncultured marine virus]